MQVPITVYTQEALEVEFKNIVLCLAGAKPWSGSSGLVGLGIAWVPLLISVEKGAIVYEQFHLWTWSEPGRMQPGRPLATFFSEITAISRDLR